ncbi:MAG: hypothetical protein ACI4MI_04650 [Christensenellales bacterium]
MNEMQIWVRTALKCYGSLVRVADSLDDLLLSTGLKGFSYMGDASAMFEKMLGILRRKEKLVNLKVVVDRVFAAMNSTNAKILKLRYIDNFNYPAIARQCDICLKTAFRRSVIALEEFEKICIGMGCDAEWFEQYKSDSMVGKVYYRCRKESLSAAKEKTDGRLSDKTKERRYRDNIVTPMADYAVGANSLAGFACRSEN